MTTRALATRYLLTAAAVLAVTVPGCVLLWANHGWLVGAMALAGCGNAADWAGRRVVEHADA